MPDDIRALLERHLAFTREFTPPEGVYALDVDGLLNPAVTFFSARIDAQLVAVGALKQLDDSHAELKSMHTVHRPAQNVGNDGASMTRPWSRFGWVLMPVVSPLVYERNYRGRVSLEETGDDCYASAYCPGTRPSSQPWIRVLAIRSS